VVVDLGALGPMRCPCGWARRAFADVPDAPASVLLVEIEADARAHDHREHTGIDDVLACVAGAVLDLACPDGLQEGLSRPVALLIDEGQETEEAANRAGYLFFTDAESFRAYVRKEILAAEPTGVS
jgi:hypothetical protein